MRNDNFKMYEFKINPGPYAQIIMGYKTYEVRRWDDKRPVQRGDVLKLREWNPDSECYTGNHLLAEVLGVDSPDGILGDGVLHRDYVIISIRLLVPTSYTQ